MKIGYSAISAIAMGIVLTGCQLPSVPTYTVEVTESQQKLMKRLSKDQGTLKAAMAETTTRSWNPYHGTQVEYLAADGKTFLWYPGNSILLSGSWKTQNVETQTRADHEGKKFVASNIGYICFKYGSNSYNPVTGQQGGSWQCQPGHQYFFHSNEVVKGDVLGLSNGQLPFVMPKKVRFSLSELHMRTKGQEQAPESFSYVWKNGE